MSTHDENTSRPAKRRTWLITGASQGFGRALTSEVLSRGEHALVSVRDPQSVRDLQESHPDQIGVVVADLREPDAVGRIARAAEERFGAPDVLVNNAGRAIIGAAEEVTIEQLRESMELNFFAAAELTRAILPGMRSRGSGTVIQFSSQGGRLSFPGVGAYSASKFALEGWSEALAAEVVALGIRVMLVEPSRFRTGFNTSHSLGLVEEREPYAAVVGPVRADLAGADGQQEGDPDRAARILADMMCAEQIPLRLPLGAEAVDRLTDAYLEGLCNVRSLAELSRSADFPNTAP